MGEGLLRQRRNLIITCVLLWVMKYGGVTFSKFSFAGFDIEFKNPEALILSIWIAFTYFLWRYYQYFSGEGVSKLQQIFSETVKKKCRPIIRHLVIEKYPTIEKNRTYIDHFYDYDDLKRANWIRYIEMGSEYDPATRVHVKNEPFKIPIPRWKLWKGILAACMDTVLRNSVVTDYLLPFLLADYILYYCGTNDWNGSFLRLLTIRS